MIAVENSHDYHEYFQQHTLGYNEYLFFNKEMFIFYKEIFIAKVLYSVWLIPTGADVSHEEPSNNYLPWILRERKIFAFLSRLILFLMCIDVHWMSTNLAAWIWTIWLFALSRSVEWQVTSRFTCHFCCTLRRAQCVTPPCSSVQFMCT